MHLQPSALENSSTTSSSFYFIYSLNTPFYILCYNISFCCLIQVSRSHSLNCMISSGSSVSISQVLLTLWHQQTPTFRSPSLSVLNKQISSKASCCRAPPWITPFTPAFSLSAQSVFLSSQPMFCPP